MHEIYIIMQTRNMTRWALLTIAGILTAHLSLAQDVTGTWLGYAAGSSTGSTPSGRGPAWRWIVNFSKDSHGELKGTVSDQRDGHLFTTVVSISFIGSKLTFTFASPNGPMSFVGTLSDDGNSIEGWLLDQPVTLKRNIQTKTPPQRPFSCAV